MQAGKQNLRHSIPQYTSAALNKNNSTLYSPTFLTQRHVTDGKLSSKDEDSDLKIWREKDNV